VESNIDALITTDPRGILTDVNKQTEASSLFANSLPIIKDKASSRRVQLGMDPGEDLGSMLADARKVKQIVYNLLSNASHGAVRRQGTSFRCGAGSRGPSG